MSSIVNVCVIYCRFLCPLLSMSIPVKDFYASSLWISCYVIQVINAGEVAQHVSGGECHGKWVPAVYPTLVAK